MLNEKKKLLLVCFQDLMAKPDCYPFCLNFFFFKLLSVTKTAPTMSRSDFSSRQPLSSQGNSTTPTNKLTPQSLNITTMSIFQYVCYIPFHLQLSQVNSIFPLFSENWKIFLKFHLWHSHMFKTTTTTTKLFLYSFSSVPSLERLQKDVK